MPIEAGEIIGVYRLETALGEDEIGTTYRAVHAVLGRQAAVKVVRTELAEDSDWVARFFHEAKVVNELRHPNIVDIVDVVNQREPRRVACVMELLAGRSLREVLKSRALELREAIRVGRQIASALSAAHGRGVVHRALDLDRVFVTGDVEAIKIADFGMAKRASGAPADDVRAWAEIFAACAGSECPAELARLVHRCREVDQPSLREIERVLEEAARPPPLPPPPPAPTAPRPPVPALPELGPDAGGHGWRTNRSWKSLGWKAALAFGFTSAVLGAGYFAGTRSTSEAQIEHARAPSPGIPLPLPVPTSSVASVAHVTSDEARLEKQTASDEPEIAYPDPRDCKLHDYLSPSDKQTLRFRDRVWCGDLLRRFRLMTDGEHDLVYDAMLKGVWSTVRPSAAESQYCQKLGDGYSAPDIYMLASLVTEERHGKLFVPEIFADNPARLPASARKRSIDFEAGALSGDVPGASEPVRCFRRR